MEEKKRCKSNPYTFEELKSHAKRLVKIKDRFKKLGIYHYTKEILTIEGIDETIDAVHIRHWYNSLVLNFNLCDLVEKRLSELEIIQSDYQDVVDNIKNN